MRTIQAAATAALVGVAVMWTSGGHARAHAGPGRGTQVGAPEHGLREFTVKTLNAEPNVGASYPRVIQL